MKSLLNALQEGRLIELPEADKEQSLLFLAHILEAVPDIPGSPELAEAMLTRERAQNTGLGMGVACPHVRVSGSGDLICAVGWSPTGIDYGSMDGKKVHLVVMYYIPDAQKNVYLKEVSGLAKAVMKEDGIHTLADAQELSVVRERLLDWVSAAIDATLPEAKARMIRLEARQAAAEAAAAGGPAGVLPPGAQLQLLSVLFLTTGEEKPVILCQNPELASGLESDPGVGALLKQHAQFDRNGWRLAFRTATAYESNRTLYDYLAIRLS